MSIKRKTHYPSSWDDPSPQWDWQLKEEKPTEYEVFTRSEKSEETAALLSKKHIDDLWQIDVIMEDEADPKEKPLKKSRTNGQQEKESVLADPGINDGQKREPEQRTIGKRTIQTVPDNNMVKRSKRGSKKPQIDPNILLIAGIALMVLLAIVIIGISIAGRTTTEEPPMTTVSETPPVTVTPQYPEGTDPMTLGSITQLVNKTHGLPENFEPADLVKLEVPSLWDNYLRAEAASALASLFSAANADGLQLICCSGFRNYEEQQGIYEEETALRGEAVAKFRTSLPGFSEHQTGLAVDITCEAMAGTLETTFINTPEGQWLAEHAHEYGFIIRYPDGMEKITGYTYEPWHIRYLGKAVAEAVHNSGKTYEAYLGILN